ncbi:MAG: hypothetical protein EOP05_14155 [Proteobacteria bacterium]|nr:MAG: hypothetical protein EOP05_14155 [Pseudomonadota bacterium]
MLREGRKMIKLTFMLMIFLAPVITHAHARLRASVGVQPRSTNTSMKSGPCGTISKFANSPVLNAGQKLVVSWEETVQHPGRFEFRFSTDNDVTWSAPVTVQDTQDDPNTIPHQYSVELTLPDVTCTQCTLQMIQVMTERPQNPSNYYSCADFQLMGSGAPSPTPPPTVSPTPVPGLDTDCNMSH